MEDNKQEVSVNETVNGTVKFGFNQISQPTPALVKWIFRVYLYVASVATIIVTTDDNISANTAKQIAKYIAFGTMSVHGASKLFGVEIDENEFNPTVNGKD